MPLLFRRKLMAWYKSHARELPWRGVSDPYRTWLSEVMLQQTRVAAVIEHYENFLRRFPTMLSLALAPESEVLATWSGLGYYRRARLLHKTAQFLTTRARRRASSHSGRAAHPARDRRIHQRSHRQHRLRRKHRCGRRQRRAGAAASDWPSRGQVRRRDAPLCNDRPALWCRSVAPAKASTLPAITTRP